MARTGADILIDTLIDWGVDAVFGLPGDGINGIMEALRTRQDQIRFIQVRHEESAAFMACGYAKYTGRLGVCLATSGPGGIHLLNGLYDAKMDGQPVLAITGHHFHDLIDTFAQQDVDLDRVFEDVAVYNTRVMGPAHVENVTDLACRTALSCRGVAHINFPVDLQEQEGGRADRRATGPTTRRTCYAPAGGPAVGGRSRAGRRGAQRAAGRSPSSPAAAPSMPRTSWSKWPRRSARRSSRRCSARRPCRTTARTPPAASASSARKPSQEALEECDTLLIVGSSFPYIEFLPKPGQARGVQIDLDPMRIGLRYPVEVGLSATAARHAAASCCRCCGATRTAASWRRRRSGCGTGGELMEERGTREDKPMKPQVVAWELGKRLPDDAIVSCDSGTVATWFARQIHVRRGQMYSLSGNLATMANGLPYAIAAQIAYPDRQCVALRRRRRLLHADGGARHGGEVRAADQGHRHQEQHARADQVGADGVSRQPGIRLRAAADRLRRRSRAPAAATGFTHRGSRRSAAPCCDQALATPGPVAGRGGGRSVRAADAAQDHRRSRRPSSPSRSPGASRTAARSRSPSCRTR